MEKMADRIRKVAVIGLGTLGTQIAIQTAAYGYEVSAQDQDVEAFPRTQQKVRMFRKLIGTGPTVPVEEWEKAAGKIKLCQGMAEALNGADLVIEVVPEVLELKRKVFAQIDSLAPAGALLATNSSSIPISRIESATRRPEKCLNMHFYHPGVGWIIADIMGGTKTSPEVLETARQFLRSIACIPLTVKKEILGFCFNNVWRAIKRQTLYRWGNDFVDFRDIDRAWMVLFGTVHGPLTRGPFFLMDVVGLDVVWDIEMSYYNESKDPKDHPPQALKDKIAKGELGVKT
jgi:3-hydroxybutyryl-CoA dehydrogenase